MTVNVWRTVRIEVGRGNKNQQTKEKRTGQKVSFVLVRPLVSVSICVEVTPVLRC